MLDPTSWTNTDWPLVTHVWKASMFWVLMRSLHDFMMFSNSPLGICPGQASPELLLLRSHQVSWDIHLTHNKWHIPSFSKQPEGNFIASPVLSPSYPSCLSSPLAQINTSCQHLQTLSESFLVSPSLDEKYLPFPVCWEGKRFIRNHWWFLGSKKVPLSILFQCLGRGSWWCWRIEDDKLEMLGTWLWSRLLE